MKTMQKGFTLIELMIVVAIIGILAAIAIPAYQTYTIRAQVSEGASLAAGLQTAFAENYANTGTAAATNLAVGIPVANTITGAYVTSVKLTAGGQITVTYGNKANAKITGKTVLYTAYASTNGDIVWVCENGTQATATAGTSAILNGGVALAGGTLRAVNTGYLPAVCQ